MKKKKTNNLSKKYSKPHLESFSFPPSEGYCSVGGTPSAPCDPVGSGVAVPAGNDCEGGSGNTAGCNPTGNAANGCDSGSAAYGACITEGTSGA